LNISIEDLKSLKEAYEKVKKGNCEIFLYRGAEVLTAYAKYLIEYMENLKK
jgi:hypothetical protein